MPTKTKLLLAVICIAAAVNFWLLPPSFSPKQTNLEPTPAQKQLGQLVNRCSGIADKSVADKTVRVEFEQLAIEGIKANVMQNCMADNGFTQNPAWLSYAQPIAKANAQKNNTSLDEALTNLSRADMQIFEPRANQPDYWLKK